MPEAHDLVKRLATLHPKDTARLLESVGEADICDLLADLSDETVATVIDAMSIEFGAEVFGRLEAERQGDVLAEMDPQRANETLAELPAERRTALTQLLPLDVADRIARAQDYPTDTAGGMMQREFVALTDDLTVEGAIALLRRAPRQRLHYLYVVNPQGGLVGVLPMRELLLARARQPIAELLVKPVISVEVDDPRSRVLQLMEERKLLGLPVVDHQHRLAGVVTPAEAIQAGATAGMESMQMAVGARDENALSPVHEVVKRRLPWLYLNLLTAFAAAAVVGLFEDIIAKVTALAVLLPIVSGQGGNSGSQSLAIVMRGLALREILPGMARRVVLKEVIAGAVNGIAVAVVTALAVLIWSRSGGLALVIGLAMVVNMAAAALAGAIIPIVLRALGRDPAAASAIILTTVTDIVGFGAFLGFAVLLSQWLEVHP
jgi:magnesium transporter